VVAGEAEVAFVSSDENGPDADKIFPKESEELWAWRWQLLGRITAFVGPALFIPLADPLMSVIDTVRPTLCPYIHDINKLSF
jgi:hypothetical protein